MYKICGRTESLNFLDRERIYELLTPEKPGNLITAAADSGYGKTRSVMRFLADKHIHVVWLSLSVYDDHSGHFWLSFLQAVEMVRPDLRDKLEQIGFPADGRMLYEVNRALSYAGSVEMPIIIVFDDFHVLHNSIILQFVENLIALEGENLYYYILTRYRNGIPQGCLKNISKEITETDLAFSIEEVDAYFHQKKLHIPYDMVKEMHKETEGWPSMIYLISLAAENNFIGIDNYTNFSDSLLLEVIEQEIFSRYTREEQLFMIKLSLLDNASLSLLEALFPEEMKKYREMLEKNTMIRYNRHTRTFQVHKIFRLFLEQKCSRISEQECQRIYRQAGDWYRERDSLLDALGYYRRSKSYEAVWEVIQGIFPLYESIESARIVLETIREFPAEFAADRVMIRVAETMLLIPIGRNIGKEPDMSIAMIQELQKLPVSSESQSAIGGAYINLGFFYMSMGRPLFCSCFRLAQEHLDGRPSLYQKTALYLLNNEAVTLHRGENGEMDAFLNEMQCSEPYFTEVLSGGMTGITSLARAQAEFYRGNFVPSLKMAEIAIEQGRSADQTDIICQGYFLLMKGGVYRGDYHQAMEALRNMEKVTGSYPVIPQFHLPDIAKGWFYNALEITEAIPEWILGKHADSADTYTQSVGGERIIKAWSMLNQGKSNEVIPYLEQSVRIYRKFHKYIYLLQSHMLLGIACYNIRNLDMAVIQLHKAGQMGWNNGIIVPYAVFGRHSRSFLAAIKKLKSGGEKIADEHISQLLAQIPEQWLNEVAAKATTIAKRNNVIQEHYLSEHPRYQMPKPLLAEREIDILKGICEGLTREEIADTLELSQNTVKSMTKQIYAKLGAINGMHAVRLAMQKGLL